MKYKTNLIFDDSISEKMFNVLKLKNTKCQQCDIELKHDNWGGIVDGKPICKNITCLLSYVMKEEKNDMSNM